MAGPTPSARRMSEIKSRLLRPALTSHYYVHINADSIRDKRSQVNNSESKVFFNNRQVSKGIIGDEFISLSCSEASLPGSSLATNEINDDHTGVTERHAYRRLYDDRIDFTFYVDHDHNIIKFFETWISWIVGEDQYNELGNSNYHYRVKFPTDYRVSIFVQKFERDYTKYSEYEFVDAYPISISSMPVSYDSSSLLKCTVSFTYSRYFMGNSKYNNNSLVQTQLDREDELRRNLPPNTTFLDGGIDDIINSLPPSLRASSSIFTSQQLQERFPGLF